MNKDESAFIARLRALLEVLPPALDRQVAPLGLTSYEFALLDTIGASDQGRLRLSRLASSTSATLPRLSRVITALERKGLVERAPSPDDARATDAVLTPAGRRTLEEAAPRMEVALQRHVIDPLEPDQLRAASAAILAILTSLDPDGRRSMLEPKRGEAR